MIIDVHTHIWETPCARRVGVLVPSEYVAEDVGKHLEHLIVFCSVDFQDPDVEGTPLPRIPESKIEALINRDTLDLLGLA